MLNIYDLAGAVAADAARGDRNPLYFEKAQDEFDVLLADRAPRLCEFEDIAAAEDFRPELVFLHAGMKHGVYDEFHCVDPVER